MPGPTFVYVSNAADGDISTYRLTPEGDLKAGPRVRAALAVMPMTVSADKRFLYAAARSTPHAVFVYAIDRATGALTAVDSSPLAESMAYISLDRTGRFLFAASYGYFQFSGASYSAYTIDGDQYCHGGPRNGTDCSADPAVCDDPGSRCDQSGGMSSF